MEVRAQRDQRGRDTSSPDHHAKMCSSSRRLMKQKVKPAAARKVQVVYYLSRNGLLEHPHFMELTLFPNQPLRLKDVFDRLKALRGSGMPLQYSWSSKRTYKSGYVWHDLALKDIIHPAEGGQEYVLKGSELVQGCSERFQLLNVSNKQAMTHHQMPEPNCSDDYYYSKHNKQTFKTQTEPQEYEEVREHEEREKASSYTNTSSTTAPHSRCSKGVSTEELGDDEDTTKVVINTTTTSNSTTLAQKVRKKQAGWANTRNNNPKRFIEDDPLTDESTRRSRHSVLLQLIACGSSVLELNKAKLEAPLSSVGTSKKLVFSDDPRLLQYREDKEYFSGSIVESMKALEAEPVLNRSNSYDEQQRRSKEGMEEVKKIKVMEEDKSKSKGRVKERCIPCKKSSKNNKN